MSAAFSTIIVTTDSSHEKYFLVGLNIAQILFVIKLINKKVIKQKLSALF